MKATPFQASLHPLPQKRRRSSGIPIRLRPRLYLRRSQRMIRPQARLSIALNTALDTAYRK